MEEVPDKEKKGSPGCGGFAVYLIAAIIGIMLISGAISAYADGTDAGDRKGEYDSTIDSLKVKLDRETKEAINNLDPDYRRAVAERDRGVLAPGEELLPIYDDE